MNKLLMLLAVFAVSACGPEWAECETCKPGEPSAQADDGTQIPVVVNVDVDVNVNQSQNQGQAQGQGQTQTNTNTNTTNNPPASTPDAGTPPTKPDAGTPDSGTPDAGTLKPDAGTPKSDAGCPPVCRKVCTCTETRYICKGTGKDTSRRSDCTCGVQRTYTKCTKEVVQCS